MKKSLVIVFVLFAFMFSGVAEEPATSYEGVAIGVIGDWTSEYVERVRAFVQANTRIPVRLIEPVYVSADTLGGTLDVVAAFRGAEDAVVVFLYAGQGEFEEHTVYRYEQKAGIVNLRPLFDEEEETYLRRVEKLAIRSVALLFDVPLVPNPHSALWTYRTMEELDFMGRNLDPPSQMRLQQNAEALGITLIVPEWLLRRQQREATEEEAD